MLVAMAGIVILLPARTNIFSAKSSRHGRWDREPPICIHLHGKHCVDQYGDHVDVTDVCPETRTVLVDRQGRTARSMCPDDLLVPIARLFKKHQLEGMDKARVSAAFDWSILDMRTPLPQLVGMVLRNVTKERDHARFPQVSFTGLAQIARLGSVF